MALKAFLKAVYLGDSSWAFFGRVDGGGEDYKISPDQPIVVQPDLDKVQYEVLKEKMTERLGADMNGVSPQFSEASEDNKRIVKHAIQALEL